MASSVSSSKPFVNSWRNRNPNPAELDSRPEVREHRGILSADLAWNYGVETRVLNQAVKRNLEKFPRDFIFRLTREEAETLSRSRSQSVILKRGQNIKFLPYVFTEHGALM